ncbi:MAG: endonuclease domain-containing protein [Pirellula sp.]
MKRSRARSSDAIEFARAQRRTSNEFSDTVWQWIRNRQVGGVKLRREYPIPPYTVDFCAIEPKLVIEIDGVGHLSEGGQLHDQIRDRFLNSLGYQILRIPGYEILREDGDAIKKIRMFVERDRSNPSPPDPLPEAGRGAGSDDA